MKDLTVLEEELRAALADIRPGDKTEEEKALRHWDAVAKPLHGLGQLEGVVARMAAVAPLREKYAHRGLQCLLHGAGHRSGCDPGRCGDAGGSAGNAVHQGSPGHKEPGP